ncbi:MAG: hypothetical protein NT034_01660, partial [Candidatus Magasanikbacteria bacterium]|nr:hypothetical protein [Candidatus Magasanikbacteria bacterium]
MASNAARKLAPREQGSQPEANGEILKKKEIKKKEIADVFGEARERVEGKGQELDRMQAELTDLLNKIPDQEDGDFQARLKEFAFKFKVVKQHLKSLAAEAQLEQLPSGAFAAVDAGEPPEVPPADKIEGISEIKNFKDAEGSVLTGVVNEKVKDKKTFRGVINFADGGSYTGFAALNDEGVYNPSGDGVWEKSNGMVFEGFFKDGRLKNGHIVENFKNGETQVQFMVEGEVSTIEKGKFNSNDELDGIGERINNKTKEKEQGKFVNGEFVDGYVVNFITGKPTERFKNGVSVEMGDNLPELKTDLADSNIKEAVKQIEQIAGAEKIAGLVNFVDARGHVLNGSLVSNPDGKYFNGQIKTKELGSEEGAYDGIAILNEKTGTFEFDDTDAEYSYRDGSGRHTKKGEFKNGEFISGTDTISGYPSSTITIEKGVIVERETEVSGIKDATGTVLTVGKKVDGRSRVYYEGKFRMRNGKIYEGKADFKDGKFDWSNEGKGKGVMGKVVDIFKNAFSKKKTQPTFGSKFGLKKKETSSPVKDSEPKDQAVVEQEEVVVSQNEEGEGEGAIEAAIAKRIIEKVSELDKLNNFTDAYGQILNGKITHTKDGKHIFDGKIEFHGEPAYEYEGKALLNADGMFEPFDEAQIDKSKEKGRLSKIAEVVFSKAGAKIASETTYKTAAGILGVKLGTDIMIAGVAAILEKRAGTKDLAAKIGEYSDVHKFLVGKNEISAIKEGFAEFMKTLNPEDGEDFELNLVDEKYSALKAKIESSGQIDPEAKGKLLAKLEKTKQNFDAENKKLEDEEKDEAEKYMQAYLVNKTAGMQLVRDGLNGMAKLAIVATGGVGVSLLAKEAAIGRVFGMATTKIIERRQKNKKFNEQMKVEEKEAVGTLKDFKFALLETMHGLSGGVFNGGKDVKTGKQLTEMQRLGNFGKSIGNVLVAVGVTLGVKG